MPRLGIEFLTRAAQFEDSLFELLLLLLELRIGLLEFLALLLYLLLLTAEAGIDLPAAALAKIGKNAAKYPVEKARGSSRKYTELE